jgi:hypothetical protein
VQLVLNHRSSLPKQEQVVLVLVVVVQVVEVVEMAELLELGTLITRKNLGLIMLK